MDSNKDDQRLKRERDDQRLKREREMIRSAVDSGRNRHGSVDPIHDFDNRARSTSPLKVQAWQSQAVTDVNVAESMHVVG